MSLLIRIDRYLREHRMPPTRFGRLSVNDPRLVSDLKQGRVLRHRTLTRVDAFLNGEAR